MLTPQGIAISRAWLGLLVLGAAVGAVVSLAVAVATPPNYVGQATLLLTPSRGAASITVSDLGVAQALAPTFAELATTGPVLQRVIASTRAAIGVESLARAVTTHVPVGTSLIEIAVTANDSATAAALANAIAAELMNYPSLGLQPQTSTLKLTLTSDPALPPRAAEGLGVVPRTVLGGGMGLLIAISLAFLVENLSRAPLGFSRRVDNVPG